MRPAFVGYKEAEMLDVLLELAHSDAVTVDPLRRMLNVLFITVLESQWSDDHLVVISMIRDHANQYYLVKADNLSIITTSEEGIIACIEESIGSAIDKAQLNYRVDNIQSLICNSNYRTPEVISHGGRDIYTFECQRQLISDITHQIEDAELHEKLKTILQSFDPDSHDSDMKINNFKQCRNLYADSLSKMRRVVSHNINAVRRDMIQQIFDDDIEKEVNTKIDSYKSLGEFDNKLENEILNVADVLEFLFEKLNTETDERHQDVIKNAMDECSSAAALAANYLHPKYQGNQFRNLEPYVERMMNFLIDCLSNAAMRDLNQFTNGRSLIFETLMARNIQSATEFWMFASTQHPELASLALPLLEVPAYMREINMKEATVHKNLTEQQAEKASVLFYTLKMNEKKTK